MGMDGSETERQAGISFGTKILESDGFFYSALWGVTTVVGGRGGSGFRAGLTDQTFSVTALACGGVCRAFSRFYFVPGLLSRAFFRFEQNGVPWLRLW